MPRAPCVRGLAWIEPKSVPVRAAKIPTAVYVTARPRTKLSDKTKPLPAEMPPCAPITAAVIGITG